MEFTPVPTSRSSSSIKKTATGSDSLSISGDQKVDREEYPRKAADKLPPKSLEKYRAAAALNLCMVSLSQIVDYNDINILRMEYEAILNNINLEYIPKDEALLRALQNILDTCHFFTLHEKDKELLKKKRELRLKTGLSNINFFVITGGGNPYAAAANLALMIGVAAVNYKTQKAKAEYENEAEEWELQKSALEQLHQLRGVLFTTAWRLADKYNYKDEWRLSEKQISLYNEILTDPDPFSRYKRLEVIQDKFTAYPLFFYYLAHSAIESTYEEKNKNDIAFKNAMYQKAENALKLFNDYYSQAALLREDQVAASAYLDCAEIFFHKASDSGQAIPEASLSASHDPATASIRTQNRTPLESAASREELKKSNLQLALDAVKNAERFAGFDFAILQNCVFQYLRGIKDKMAEELSADERREIEDHVIRCLNILIANDYNVSVNSKILSTLYIKHKNKTDYDVLYRLVSNRSVFPYRHIFPWAEEVSDGIHNYEKEVQAFFQTEQFKNIVSNFFTMSITLSITDFLQACDNAKTTKNTTSLCHLFEDKEISNRMWENLYYELLNPFLELSKREEKCQPLCDSYQTHLLELLKSQKDKFFTHIKNINSNSTNYWVSISRIFYGTKAIKEEDYKDSYSELMNNFEQLEQFLNELSKDLSNFFENTQIDQEVDLKFLDLFEEQIELKRKKALSISQRLFPTTNEAIAPL